MNGNRIGVGIVGVQPGRSWGAVAHIPALRALPASYEIIGIANSSQASAEAAAKAIGVSHGFASVEALIADPRVDLVAITVKVPHHAEIARKATAAGKHVYCEWPLGRTLGEAEEMARSASDMGIVAVAGAQAVVAPAVRRLAALIEQRAFGTLLSATIVGNGMTWGPSIEQRNAYLLDAHNGATMLTIAVGHTLAAVEAALGPITDVFAALHSRREQVLINETGKMAPLRAPDQVLLSCTLANGMPLSLHYRGGAPAGLGLLWEIDGSDGSARIDGPSGLTEMAPLTLAVRMRSELEWATLEQPVEDPVSDGVRILYAAMAARITGGMGEDLFTFDDAVRLHRLLAAIETSAECGRRVSVCG